MNQSEFQEAYYQSVYDKAYQACIAQGDDRRVARAMAKSAETDARRQYRGRQRAAEVAKRKQAAQHTPPQLTEAQPAPHTAQKKVRVITVRRSYDTVANL